VVVVPSQQQAPHICFVEFQKKSRTRYTLLRAAIQQQCDERGCDACSGGHYRTKVGEAKVFLPGRELVDVVGQLCFALPHGGHLRTSSHRHLSHSAPRQHGTSTCSRAAPDDTLTCALRQPHLNCLCSVPHCGMAQRWGMHPRDRHKFHRRTLTHSVQLHYACCWPHSPCSALVVCDNVSLARDGLRCNQEPVVAWSV
jgi:hypothetical protein